MKKKLKKLLQASTNLVPSIGRLALLTLFVLTATLTKAQWRSADEALALLSQTAGGSGSQAMRNAKAVAANANARILHTMKMDGKNTIYVVGNGAGGGVTLVSGFEGNGILGYTDRGGFNIDSIPPALKQMMQDYSKQMIAAAKNWSPEMKKAMKQAPKTARQPIDHLIQTKWEQYEPYNNMCPGDYPTGCVATCMAQIMKYYNYPKRGKGSASYTWNGQTLSANFGATEYQWDKMIEKYQNGCYSKESADAVATLMFHLGVAAKMNYNTGGSGAVMKSEILTDYFDYSTAAVTRSINGTDEDQRLMYEELEKKHPIPYSGQSSVSGHAFIVDGYRDGLWGINWGWKGYCDGFFALGALNPMPDQKYNYSNKAILGLVPNGSYTADKAAEDGEFTVTTPGTLRNMLGRTRYKKLKIHGNINGEDLRELRSRCSCEDYKYETLASSLVSLDLSDANLVAGGVYRLEASLSDPNNVKYWDCVALKDTLSWGAFTYSDLEELLLPASIKTMETQAIYFNQELTRLRLPSEMEAYEESAISSDNDNLQLEVAAGAKPIVEGNVLYLKDHKKLCLALGAYDKFTVNNQCQEIDGGAFNNQGNKFGMIVVPQLKEEFRLGYQNIDKLWLAGNVEKGISIQKIYDDIHIDLYLPSPQMVKLNTTNNYDNYVGSVYIPEKLLAQYMADKNWSTYKNCFKVIDNVNMCVDDSHIGLKPEATMNLYEKQTLTPLIYDSNLISATATWSSSNEKVATVDSEGYVSAVGTGSANITVNINGYKATCRLTVTEWPTVNVEQPGTLAALINGKDYEYLAITGNINGDDFKELKSRGMYYEDTYTPEGKRTIRGLNLTDANIVDGGVYLDEDNRQYECKANTISKYLFAANSCLRILLLPRSVTTMESYGIVTCDKLQVLKLPESLKKYDSSAMFLYHQSYDVDVEVPESSCLTMKDGVLYNNDFSRLYLCLNRRPKIIIDTRCKDIDSDAFSVYSANYETVIAPSVTSFYTNAKNIKNLWLGNAYSVSPYSTNNSELTVFLPSKVMANLNQASDEGLSCKKILVPQALLEKYKTDEKWSKHAKSIEAIEDCGIVLDECRVLMPENMVMMGNSFGNINPQMLDTRLMNEKMTLTSNYKWIVNANSDDELMSFKAGEADITVRVGDVEKVCRVSVLPWPTVNVEQPGTFASIVGDNTYKYLKVTGNINGDDLRHIRYLCNANDVGTDSYFTSTNSNPVMEYLDLKDARLKKGGVYGSFWGYDYSLKVDDDLQANLFSVSNLKMLRLPAYASNTGQYERTMQYNHRMEYVELPEDLKCFSKYLIKGSEKLKAMIYRGKQFLQPDTEDEFTEFKDVTLYVRQSLLNQFLNNSVYTSAFKKIEPLDDEMLDGIESVEMKRKVADGTIYNIMGQKMSTLQRGINIINGKKVLIDK